MTNKNARFFSFLTNFDHKSTLDFCVTLDAGANESLERTMIIWKSWSQLESCLYKYKTCRFEKNYFANVTKHEFRSNFRIERRLERIREGEAIDHA